MKVIREGNPKQIECGHCKSILEYEPLDVKTEKVHMNEYKKYIECPVCKRSVEVK